MHNVWFGVGWGYLGIDFLVESKSDVSIQLHQIRDYTLKCCLCSVISSYKSFQEARCQRQVLPGKAVQDGHLVSLLYATEDFATPCQLLFPLNGSNYSIILFSWRSCPFSELRSYKLMAHSGSSRAQDSFQGGQPRLTLPVGEAKDLGN